MKMKKFARKAKRQRGLEKDEAEEEEAEDEAGHKSQTRCH